MWEKLFNYLKKDKEFIYLDKASTKCINEKYNKLLYYENKVNFQNLSAISPQSVRNKKILNKVVEVFRVWFESPNYHFIFTSGATESLNLAFKGVAFQYLLNKKNKENRLNIVLSKVEHKAGLEIVKFIKELGFEIRYIPILNSGVINDLQLRNLIDTNTILVSLPYINNETGNIQPLKKVGLLKEKYDFIFHCDVTASLANGPFNLAYYRIDMASFSAHKMCGIKGIGGIAVKNINQLCPLIHGGGQQYGVRGGTENFPALKVWGVYLENKLNTYKEDQKKIQSLDLYCIKKFKNEFKEQLTFNSLISNEKRLAGIINLSIKDISNLDLVAFLANKNIYIGTGSACNNINLKESEVLKAMGISEKEQKSVLRISFDEENDFYEFDQLINNIRIFKADIENNQSEENEEENSPDCESYRKLAFQSWYKRLKGG